MSASSSRPHHTRAVLFLLSAAILWSTAGFTIKYIQWNALAISGVRSAIAALVFLVVFRNMKISGSWLQIVAALAYAATVSMFVVANKMTTAANAILLQYTAPVYVALLGAWLLKEKTTLRDWLTIGAVLAGMLLFFLEKMTPGNMWGNFFALASGFTFALFIVLLRKQKDESPAAAVFLGNIITFAIGLPFMFDDIPAFSGWMALLFLGVFQLGSSYVLYTMAIPHVTAMEAILIPLIEPVLNPIWVFLLMGEIPAWSAILGGFVILAAVTFRNLKGK